MNATSLLGLVLIFGACGGTARNVATYGADTQRLLSTRSDQLKSCYDDALKNDAKLAGTVTVHFVVEKQTGAITKSSVDTAKTTAPDVLGQCVLKGVDGLVLAPGDRNEGEATFVYDFKATSAAAPSS